MNFNIDDYKKELDYKEYYNIPREEYSKIKAFNYSSVKEGEKGPLYLKHALIKKWETTSKSLDFGNIFHCYIFEQEKFNKLYYFSEYHMDGRKARSEEGKSQLSHESIFKNGGKKRIDLNEGEKIKKMADSLFSHPMIRKCLEMKGRSESTLIWKNLDLGLNFKGILDKIPDTDLIIDMKSTKASYFKSFKRDFFNYGYDIQSAIYTDGFKNIYNEDREYVIIAQNKDEPYAAEIFPVSEETIQKGRTKYYKYIEDFIAYVKNPNIIYEELKTL